MFVLHERNYIMKNKNHTDISLLLQTIIGGLFLYLMLFLGVEWLYVSAVLFLIQFIDIWKRYPGLRERIKRFFCWVIVLVFLFLETFSEEARSMTLVFLAFQFSCLMCLFVPYYYLKTLNTWIKTIALGKKRERTWEETEILDDNHFAQNHTPWRNKFLKIS